MLDRDEKSSQDLLVFKISPRALDFASREAIFRPGSLKKPARWDFATVVTHWWKDAMKWLG